MASNSNSNSTSNNENGNGEPNIHERSLCCFQEWMQLQRQDLSLLLQFLDDNDVENDDDEEINNLVQEMVSHFQDYVDKRRTLSQECVSSFYAPTWCTSLENSLLWIAGCRPSIFIRLLYALSGCELESRVSDLLREIRPRNLSISDMSPDQLTQIDNLRMVTIREEEKLTNEVASIQEEVADEPLAVIVSKMEGIGEINEDVDKALEEHEKVMKGAMDKADDLRMTTFKELVKILNPIQMVEFLIASKKLHLSLHQWGQSRDQKDGRRN